MTMQAKAVPTPGIPRCRPVRVPTSPALGNSPGAGRALLNLKGLIPDPDMLRARDAEEKRRRRRAAIEALIERAIEALDALDGDPDLEPEHEGRCEAHDDDLAYRWSAGGMGDDTDNEPDDDDMGAADEPNFPRSRRIVSGAGVDPLGRPGVWVPSR